MDKFKTTVHFTEALVTPDYSFKSIRMKPLDEIGNIHKHTPIRAIDNITQLFGYSDGKLNGNYCKSGYLAIIDGKLNHLEMAVRTNYDLNFWDVYGQFYGFPECCIKHFNESSPDRPYFTQDHPFYGTGFVPCQDCVNKPYGEMIEGIRIRRFFSVPFTEKGSKDSDDPKLPELVNFLVNHYQPKLFK